MNFERFHPDGALPPTNATWIWVFGSNLAGRHGAGAALIALQSFGAVRGQGVGHQGCAYGIPTKSETLAVLPIAAIHTAIDEFLAFAREHADRSFYVTRVGCGLAGYKDREIAPLFASAPSNCSLPINWRPFITA